MQYVAKYHVPRRLADVDRVWLLRAASFPPVALETIIAECLGHRIAASLYVGSELVGFVSEDAVSVLA